MSSQDGEKEVRKLVIPTENGANNLSFCPAEDSRNVVAFQFNVSARVHSGCGRVRRLMWIP